MGELAEMLVGEDALGSQKMVTVAVLPDSSPRVEIDTAP